MPKNTLTAFFFAGSMDFLGGILSLIATCILFSNALIEDDSFYCILVGVFMDILEPFFFCLLFLLPLAAIEKTKIEERSFIALIKRYTPLITIPFGVLSAFTLLSTYEYPTTKYPLLIIEITAFSVCAFSLWSFIKRLKSS